MRKQRALRHPRSTRMRNEADALEVLQRRIIASRACPRLVKYCTQIAQEKRARFRDEKYWGKAVPGFGDPQAELLILGLAPAAHGANRTGRMFTGDRSGDFLFRALHEAGFANQPTSVRRDDGLKLSNCYITSVVHWAPPKNKPRPDEIRTSLPFLEEELRLLRRVQVVLVLGKIAFDAYLRLLSQREGFPPKSTFRFIHGASYRLPRGLPRLFCSYHPSQQNTQTGKLTVTMFRKVLRNIRQYLDLQHSESSKHETFMRRAIELAKIARKHGDSPVGAVVVRGERVISRGIEGVKSGTDVSAHAELAAIREACRRLRTFDLSGSVLYTTAEPCFMCSYAVRQTRISEVVIGRSTPRKGGFSSRHPILTDPEIVGWGRPPEVTCGVLEAECRAL